MNKKIKWSHLKAVASKDKNGNPNPIVVVDGVTGKPINVAAEPKKSTRTVSDR